MSSGECKWNPSPKTGLFEVLGTAVAGKVIEKITAHSFSGVLRDSIALQRREGATASPKWEGKRLMSVYSYFFLLHNLSHFSDRGLILPDTHPSPDSEVLTPKLVFVLVDFIGSVSVKTSGKWQKFHVRSQFFPLCISILQGYIVWQEK